MWVINFYIVCLYQNKKRLCKERSQITDSYLFLFPRLSLTPQKTVVSVIEKGREVTIGK